MNGKSALAPKGRIDLEDLNWDQPIGNHLRLERGTVTINSFLSHGDCRVVSDGQF
jgi:hypothetical protein